jgi:hypothetical protein
MQGLRGRLHLQDRTLVPKLEERAEALAGTLNTQDVANTLWAACVFFIFGAPVEGSGCMQIVFANCCAGTRVPGQVLVLHLRRAA